MYNKLLKTFYECDHPMRLINVISTNLIYFEYLKQNKLSISYEVFENLIHENNLIMFKYICENGFYYLNINDDKLIVITAMEFKRLDFLQYIHYVCGKLCDSCVHKAAEIGYLEGIKFYENIHKIPNTTYLKMCELAAEHGHLETLKYVEKYVTKN